MKVLAILNVTLLLFSCQHNSMNPETLDKSFQTGIQLQIDLQQGFAGKFVRVELNGEEQFRGTISDLVPFAGPEASFTSTTFQKRNLITVYWRCPNSSDCGNLQHTQEISLGNSEKYYVGMVVSGNSIILQVLDTPFFYL